MNPFVKTSRILAWILFLSTVVVAYRRWEHTPVLVNGRPQCSCDPPFVTLTHGSAYDCSLACLGCQSGKCVAFNYRVAQCACDLYLSESGNYTETVNCTFYQARNLSISYNLCQFSNLIRVRFDVLAVWRSG